MSSVTEPRYSVNQFCTPKNTVLEDVAQVAGVGADGIGLWTGKFDADRDEQVLSALAEHDLAVSFCLPEIWTFHPPAFAETPDLSPAEIADRICDELPRLAAFEPDAVMIGPGVSGDPSTSVGPLEPVRDGLVQVAQAAADHDLRVTFELLAERRGSPLSTLPDIVDFIDETGCDNVDVCFDIYHSWREPHLHYHLRQYADRINGVHVNDIRWEERNAFDREFPGDGRNVAPPIIATLLDAGYDGWWEFEVFSDDGRFRDAFPHSLWDLPHEEFLAAGTAAFERTYAEAAAIAMARRGR